MDADHTVGTGDDGGRGLNHDVSPPNQPTWSLSERLFRPVDPATLALFRIGFAVTLLPGLVGRWSVAATSWPAPWEYRPSYGFTPFLEGWAAPDSNLVLPLAVAALVGIGLGFLTRVSSLLFAAVYGYTFALDPLAYNNHYVLIVLVAGWLAIVRSNAIWSVDARLFGAARTIPFWHQAIFRFQLCVVYFYGGLAKLNGDWLRAEPVRPWLLAEADLPVIGPWLAQPWAPYFVAWYGLVFDLTLPFLLCWRRTRWLGIGLAILFHLSNSVLFEIGVFPWMGIVSLVVFLDPDAPRRLLERFRQPSEPIENDDSSTPKSTGQRSADWQRNLVTAGLVFYAVVQLVVPLRHLLYAGNVEWTEEGKNFSWRMMLSYKQAVVGFVVTDGRTGRKYVVDPQGDYLPRLPTIAPGERALFQADRSLRFVPSRLLSRNRKRLRRLYNNPRLLAQYARFLAADARAAGVGDPRVSVTAIASLNGRPFQHLVDPDRNLADVDRSPLWTPNWIVPLREGQPIGDYPVDDAETMQRAGEVIGTKP